MPPTANIIAQLCFHKFSALPKSGKPTSREWTVLAGVVQHDATKASNKVVALGAGTKCIGENESRKKNKNGCVLNDSHAEVLARRALLRYFYQELKKAAAATAAKVEEPHNSGAADSIFTWHSESGLFQLRPDISFHFISTKTPCGDACIVTDTTATVIENEVPQEVTFMKKSDSQKEQLEFKDEPKRLPESLEHPNGCVPRKRRKIAHPDDDDDSIGNLMPSSTVSTGAKLIGTQHKDPMHQAVGAVRVKPGRGNRTLSMSCSDKLAKWNVMGVQGALLHALLEQPIYFETLTFAGDSGSSNKASLERAIYGRFAQRIFHSDRFKTQQPEIRICTEASFQYAQQPSSNCGAEEGYRATPSPNGLAWCAISDELKPYEVSVNGLRQGVNQRQPNNTKAALKISKYFLLREFIDLIIMCKSKFLMAKCNIKNCDDLLRMPYVDFKQLAQTYQVAWAQVKRNYFLEWTQKPAELLAFSIADGVL